MSHLNMHGIPTAAATVPPPAFVVECDPCRFYGNQRLTSRAAEEIAGQHDDLHHQGALTAYVCRERS